MGFISEFFDLFLINPLTNLFVLLTTLTGNAGIAVILLTIIIRIVTLPLNLKQMHSTRVMSALAPRMQEINKRYSDPRKRSEEQMKLYREAGFNPIGCFSSMLIQFPILIALYRTFRLAVGESPESLIKLSERIYPWDYLRSGLPLPADFLWMHLGQPDPFVLPLLVAVTTYTLQKMTTVTAGQTEQQRAQASLMNFMMPLLFGWITLTLPSGLGLYYVLSNVIGMLMQYAYVGGGPFNWRALVGLSQEPVLPRQLAVRERHAERVRKLGRENGEAPVPSPQAPSATTPSTDGMTPNAAPAEKAGAGGGRRRRRRYGRGRR
jgi:YidC/Oxa1 family membrane protein insertase